MDLVVTRARALAEGLTPAEVDAHVRSGRWLSLRRGTYLTQPRLPDGRVQRHAVEVAAAVLAVPGRSAGSHGSAALLHGLPQLLPHAGAPVLTRDREDRARGATRKAATLVARLPPEHLQLVHGAQVTSVARTACDLARGASALDAVLVLDAALRTVSREEVLEVLDAQRGWPGSVRARRRVSFADGAAESALESLGRLRMAQLRLPVPELQVVLPLCDGRSARVDYLWQEFRTVGEADGRGKYDAPEALWAEKRREDALRDAGYEVVRFTWDEALRHPGVIADRARRAFARARSRAA